MSGSLTLLETAPLPLAAATAEFLADCRLRGLSPRTIEWYRYALEPFRRFAVRRGQPDAASVTVKTVRAFLAEQSARVGPRRLNHYREVVDRLYRWLVVEEYLPTNPASGIRKVREPRKLVAAFNEAELTALLDQPDTRTFIGLRDCVFMLLLLDTGLRLSEALGLRVDDVDLEGGTLRTMGKGGKERVVGFSSDLERHLRRYLVRRDVALAGIGRAESPWFVPNQQGGKGAAKGFQQRLKQYGRAASITRVRASPHTFRHTFALCFVRNGGSPFHLQKTLGHTSLDISRRYCELADVDFITSQRELSPLAKGHFGTTGPRRMR